MRIRPVPASMRYPKLRFALTDHPITVWAGAILLRLSDELIGLRVALITLLTPFAKSPDSQIPAINVLLVWWYGLALEADRFEHFTHYRRDPLELGVEKKARRGSSFLCTDQYFARYIAGGRGKGEPDTGTNQPGFRLVQEVGPKMSTCA
ncbi:MAG: hypothetical protein NW703_11440 [Nitrospiraceae bacterium]